MEIRGVAYTTYQFAVAFSNTNACNIYTKRLFSESFRYYDDEKKLKCWYENTVQAFHNFWEEHIKATYFEDRAD